eukprot:gene5585-11257_t
MSSHMQHNSQQFGVLFNVLFTYMSYKDSGPDPDLLPHISGSTQKVKAKSASVVAHIASTCADAIIALGLLDQLCSTVQGAIVSGELLPQQKTSMIQTLIAICAKIPNITQQTTMLTSVLSDMVSVWTSSSSQYIFSSPESLLVACLNKDPVLDVMLDSLHTFLASCKKVQIPILPDEMWTSSCIDPSNTTPLTPTTTPTNVIYGLPRDQYITFNISSMLPGIVRALIALHGIWDPSLRMQHQQQQIIRTVTHIHTNPSTGPGPGAVDFCTIYLPSPTEVTNAVGCISAINTTSTNSTNVLHSPDDNDVIGSVDGRDGSNTGTSSNQSKLRNSPLITRTSGEIARNALTELRTLLYGLLGYASKHKVLYFHPHISPPLSDANTNANTPSSSASSSPSLFVTLVNHLNSVTKYLDNRHVIQLLKFVIGPFVMNAPPTLYPEISALLAPFLFSMLDRMAVAWTPSTTSATTNRQQDTTTSTDTMSQEEIYLKFLYRYCSIPSDYPGLVSDQIDAAREAHVSTLTRSYTDILSSLSMTTGFLALAPEEAVEKKIKMKQRRSGQNEERAESETTEIEESTKGSPQVLKARREALMNLLLRHDHIAGPYLATIIAFLSVPDSNSCRKVTSVQKYQGIVKGQFSGHVHYARDTDAKLFTQVPAISQYAFDTAYFIGKISKSNNYEIRLSVKNDLIRYDKIRGKGKTSNPRLWTK